MKKVLAFIFCIALICAISLTAFAEDEVDTPIVETESAETEAPTPETEPAPAPDTSIEEDAKTITEKISEWFEANSGALSIVVSIIGTLIAVVKCIKKVINSAITMNNNAIAISEKSDDTAKKALNSLENAVEVIGKYETKMTDLLAEVGANEEEKQKLQQALVEANTLLKSARQANKTLAAEVAKLITLANLPNAVKDEMYADFLNNVRAVLDAETPEVKEDVGFEA